MKKLFTKGILIAFGFVLASAMFNSSAQNSKEPITSEERTKVLKKSSTELTNLMLDLGNSETEVSKYRVFKTLFDQRGSLKLLREELLSQIDGFESEISPALNEALLDELLEKFTQDDLESWPDTDFILDGEATEAREFVNDVTAINSNLGKYLETSALMFHRLHVLTNGSKVFNRRKELRKLVSRADTLFADKLSLAESAKDFIKEDILSDPVFLRNLESSRCREVGKFLLKRKPILAAKIDLIASIDTNYCQEDFFSSYEEFLGKLAFNSSFSERESFLVDESVAEVISPAYERYPHLQTLQSELFALGAVDSIEAGDVGQAEAFLEESLSLEEGLESQDLVASYLANEREVVSRLRGVEIEDIEDLEEDYSEEEYEEEAELEEVPTTKKKRRKARVELEEEDLAEEEYVEEEEEESSSKKKKKQPRSLGIWIFIIVLGILFIAVITAVFFIILNKLKEEQETDDYSYDSGDIDEFDEEDFWGEEEEDLLDDELSEKQANDS